MTRYEMMERLPRIVLALALPFLISVTPAIVVAQAVAGDIGGLRAYYHVFIAYTIAIALVLGWVLSIGRRLREVEERLSD